MEAEERLCCNTSLCGFLSQTRLSCSLFFTQSKSNALTGCHLCLNTPYAARFDSVRAFNSKRSFFFFFFYNDASGSRLSVSCEGGKSLTLTHLFVYVCLSTCRPPVLSQVLPRAHSASQGSVVAVHRMQDLQQLSRSRKERGEWMSEYGGLAAQQRL